jgi:hypothetical protein
LGDCLHDSRAIYGARGKPGDELFEQLRFDSQGWIPIFRNVVEGELDPTAIMAFGVGYQILKILQGPG